MSQISIEPGTTENGEFEALDLELCPPATQVMPPQPKYRFSFFFTVIGNVLLGSMLLAAMLMLPSLMSGLLTAF